MPVERKPYSVTRQMIMVIIPFLDLWAAYRIEKLRYWLLIFLLGFGILRSVVLYPWEWNTPDTRDDHTPFFADINSEIIFIVVAIIIAMIVIRKWTMEWNKACLEKKK